MASLPSRKTRKLPLRAGACSLRSVPEQPQRFAARCAYLKMTMGERPGGHLVNICRHIIRDGRECVGPFLDDHETSCGIWEPAPGHLTIPAARNS